MHKLKRLLSELETKIHDMIEEAGGDITLDDATEISGLCGIYNEIAMFAKCTHKRGGSHHRTAEGENGEWLLENIGDELDGADKYYQKWLESNDEVYRTLARDELRHGESLMAEAKKDGVDVDAMSELFRDLHTKLTLV